MRWVVGSGGLVPEDESRLTATHTSRHRLGAGCSGTADDECSAESEIREPQDGRFGTAGDTEQSAGDILLAVSRGHHGMSQQTSTPVVSVIFEHAALSHTPFTSPPAPPSHCSCCMQVDALRRLFLFAAWQRAASPNSLSLSASRSRSSVVSGINDATWARGCGASHECGGMSCCRRSLERFSLVDARNDHAVHRWTVGAGEGDGSGRKSMGKRGLKGREKEGDEQGDGGRAEQLWSGWWGKGGG